MELEESNKTNIKNKNIEYKGPSIYTKNTAAPINKKYSSSDDIENFLLKEKDSIKNEPWSRLRLSDKMMKLNEFSKKYCKINNIDKEEELNKFLQETFKKRTKKEINYNKKDEVIDSIDGLIYNNELKKFQIKQVNKASTHKNLPKMSYSRKKKDNEKKKNNITKKNNEPIL